MGADWWLALWSKADPANQQSPRWMWQYSIFIGCLLVLGSARSFLFFDGAVKAATAMHDLMTGGGVETLSPQPLPPKP